MNSFSVNSGEGGRTNSFSVNSGEEGRENGNILTEHQSRTLKRMISCSVEENTFRENGILFSESGCDRECDC